MGWTRCHVGGVGDGNAQDRVALAAQVLAALDECYRTALTDFETIADEWAKLCTTLGRQIVVTMGQRRMKVSHRRSTAMGVAVAT